MRTILLLRCDPYQPTLGLNIEQGEDTETKDKAFMVEFGFLFFSIYLIFMSSGE